MIVHLDVSTFYLELTCKENASLAFSWNLIMGAGEAIVLVGPVDVLIFITCSYSSVRSDTHSVSEPLTMEKTNNGDLKPWICDFP